MTVCCVLKLPYRSKTGEAGKLALVQNRCRVGECVDGLLAGHTKRHTELCFDCKVADQCFSNICNMPCHVPCIPTRKVTRCCCSKFNSLFQSFDVCFESTWQKFVNQLSRDGTVSWEPFPRYFLPVEAVAVPKHYPTERKGSRLLLCSV